MYLCSLFLTNKQWFSFRFCFICDFFVFMRFTLFFSCLKSIENKKLKIKRMYRLSANFIQISYDYSLFFIKVWNKYEWENMTVHSYKVYFFVENSKIDKNIKIDWWSLFHLDPTVLVLSSLFGIGIAGIATWITVIILPDQLPDVLNLWL